MTANNLQGITVAEIAEELASRKESVKQIKFPPDILPHVAPWMEAEVEHFIVITLSGHHNVLNTVVATKGLLNRVLVHPREIFRIAIKDNAAAVIVAHNHPSGHISPSSEDREILERLVKAGELIGIPCLDFVIFGGGGYYSALDNGDMS